MRNPLVLYQRTDGPTPSQILTPTRLRVFIRTNGIAKSLLRGPYAFTLGMGGFFNPKQNPSGTTTLDEIQNEMDDNGRPVARSNKFGGKSAPSPDQTTQQCGDKNKFAKFMPTTLFSWHARQKM